jgi:hypothetical protein
MFFLGFLDAKMLTSLLVSSVESMHSRYPLFSYWPSSEGNTFVSNS